jgi:hypothetical protein
VLAEWAWHDQTLYQTACAAGRHPILTPSTWLLRDPHAGRTLGPAIDEAARPQLEDLDWRAGRVVLRGGASREDTMPLPAEVGAALSATGRRGRPATGEPPGVSAGRAGSAITIATDPRRLGHRGCRRGGGGKRQPACGNRWYAPDPPKPGEALGHHLRRNSILADGELNPREAEHVMWDVIAEFFPWPRGKPRPSRGSGAIVVSLTMGKP